MPCCVLRLLYCVFVCMAFSNCVVRLNIWIESLFCQIRDTRCVCVCVQCTPSIFWNRRFVLLVVHWQIYSMFSIYHPIQPSSCISLLSFVSSLPPPPIVFFSISLNVGVQHYLYSWHILYSFSIKTEKEKSQTRLSKQISERERIKKNSLHNNTAQHGTERRTIESSAWFAYSIVVCLFYDRQMLLLFFSLLLTGSYWFVAVCVFSL